MIKDLEKEIWKEIDGYDSDYLVSNLGRVKSFKKNSCKILKLHFNTKKYHTVHLSKWRGRDQLRTVHRLVALAFILNPDNLPQVNHKNGIKTDNRVENLEWCDNTYNQRHAWENGLGKPSKGAKNGNSKLTEFDVKNIRLEKQFLSFTELSEKYKTSISNICSIVHRMTWKHI